MALLLAVALLALGGACTSTGQAACQHPCDLAQTVRVQVSAGTVANVAVGDPCRGGGACPAGGCGNFDVSLKDSSSVPAGDGGPDLVCHVVATSTTGETVEADLTARYTTAACCSGYEFLSTALTLSFAGDASVAADQSL